MTTIVDGVKLDFSDVLFVPQRSTWNTPQHRAVVPLDRTFTFKHYKHVIECTPIIAANMDVIGTFEMADALGDLNCMTALHKFYTADQLKAFYNEPGLGYRTQYAFYSMGITDTDFEKFDSVYQHSQPKLLCIDVANGYTEKFIAYVSKI